MTKLEKHDDWHIWTPKRGRYKNREVFFSFVKSPAYDASEFGKMDVKAAILVFKSKRTHKMTMHKGEISLYQINHNTAKLEDQKLIMELNKIFSDYKPVWEKKKLIRDAKQLLLDEK